MPAAGALAPRALPPRLSPLGPRGRNLRTDKRPKQGILRVSDGIRTRDRLDHNQTYLGQLSSDAAFPCGLSSSEVP